MVNPKKLINVEDLVHVYRDPKSRIGISVLKGIDLEVREREFLVITGPSGSGKTTLLSILSGRLKPTGGILNILNADIYSLNKDASEKIFFQNISFMNQFANDGLLTNLTVRENLEICMILRGVKKENVEVEIQQLLELVELSDKKDIKVSKLSGGEKQRVNLIGAMSSKPRILLADEPTGELDADTAMKILHLLKRFINEFNMTIVLATHDLNVIQFADRQIELNGGKLILKLENKTLVESEEL